MSMEFKDVSFHYNQNSKQPIVALEGVNLTIEKHEYVGLIGHTGSGKSTLVQHMNGLNKPSRGRVVVDGTDTLDEKANLKQLRQRVGIVFQYPEDQLFEETIYQDIAFGPKNLGLDKEEIDVRVRESMAAVGLDFEEFKDESPFEISGGQKRRVAIAGVLALKPTYLVLDEPTAGLDPRGRDEILREIKGIYEANPELTVILVTHSMEDIAEHANRILVVDQGRIAMDGSPVEIFSQKEELEKRGLTIPQITQLMIRLKDLGLDIDPYALTVEEAYHTLMANWQGGRHE